MAARPCPLCGWDAEMTPAGDRDAVEVTCPKCGRFIVTGILISSLERPEDAALLPYLSAHTRQLTEQGAVVELTTENWRDFARSHRGTPVSRKLDAVLEHIAKRSAYPGAPVEFFYSNDAPLFDAVSDEEVGYLVDYLIARKTLASTANLVGGKELIVTPEGWARLEPPSGGGIPGRCFVAMSFDPALNAAYTEGIQPAVTESGFEPLRIDLVHHNEKICDKILAEIRLAQFVVADFTLHRAGVYFEAGFAMGLGRPVIWTCRKDDLQNAHFDTRQYNHIEWETPGELRTKLADRIRATILR